MREIKFRGWHTKQGIMYSPEGMARDQLTLLPTGQFINVHGDSTARSTIYSADKFIPLQYTGLKDKSGNEIYEGDIINYEGYDSGDVQVSWSEELAAFVVSQERWKYLHQWQTQFTIVKGNIYQNPELLNGTR